MSAARECRAAARTAASTMRQPVRRRILDTLLTSGPLTADEIATAAGIDVLNVRPRVCELSGWGILAETGEKRPARCGRGRLQAVYRLEMKTWGDE